MNANKQARTAWLALLLGAALSLGGCWDDDDDDDVPGPGAAADEVPDSAGASSASFTSFIQGLDADDETSEPLLFKDSFSAPAVDEAADPIPLT